MFKFEMTEVRNSEIRNFVLTLSEDECATMLHMVASRLHALQSDTAAPVAEKAAAETVTVSKADKAFDETTAVLGRKGKVVVSLPAAKLSGGQRNGIRKAAAAAGGAAVPVDSDRRSEIAAMFGGNDHLTMIEFKTIKAAKAFMDTQKEYFAGRK